MQAGARVTEVEYLAFERRSAERHEYTNGAVVAMAGATLAHNLICSNVARLLGERLRDRPCLVLATDQRVHVRATRLYTYPDVAVICGRPEVLPEDDHTVTIELLPTPPPAALPRS